MLLTKLFSGAGNLLMSIVYFKELHVFTEILVSRARLLAMEGRKDAARDVLRYVRNARIVEILSPYAGELLIDPSRLDWQLRELAHECHPCSTGRSSGSLFSDILARLDLIAGYLANGSVVLRESGPQTSGALHSASASRRHLQVFSPGSDRSCLGVGGSGFDSHSSSGAVHDKKSEPSSGHGSDAV